MSGRSVLTRSLSAIGDVLVWVPLVAPLALAAVRFVQAGDLRLDFLMPAELFPVALIGGAVLLWAAFRDHSHRRVIGWSYAVVIAALVTSMGAAIATGLASGAAEPTGWRVVLVAGLLAVYVAALIALAVGGASLVRSTMGGPEPSPR